jgi:pyruvate dehydrogenase E2 component (dihydrolipoamide acetyltransferase)
MEEATIVRWIKREGDPVTLGETILEIETDKSTVEIDSPASGLMGPLLHPEGTTLPVGVVISYILALGETIPSISLASAPLGSIEVKSIDLDSSVSREKRNLPGRRILASPVARRVARELGVEINQLNGSGPQGRVMEVDVRRAAKTAPAIQKLPIESQNGKTRQLDRLHKVTADRMVHSFTSAPHFYLTVETDVSILIKMREGLITTIERKTGIRPTVSDLLVKIAAQALEENPEVNVLWEDGGIRNLPEINLGLAVATERGLIVPVFHRANHRSLTEVVVQRQILVEKARSGTLTLQELEGGSFTITNLGTFSVDQFNAIINPPQAAILAVGRIKDRPIVVSGELAVRPTMVVTLSVDHRILDGANAARFLDRLVDLIESPYLITSLW